MAASKHLVIVESPAKAKTIGKYLGPDYAVKASVGHVRDLPKRELGVDVEAGFVPRWVTIRGKAKVLRELSRSAERVDRVLLATDPDREGEAIAYHVAQQLGYRPGSGDARFGRVRFHEVTPEAVRGALERPAPLDMRKVEAQQARRILDRLVGYKVSPLLWKPIRPGLSAGRVQTVALRLIVEREEAIRAFEPEEYWSITAHLTARGQPFQAKLHRIDGRKFRLADERAAAEVVAGVQGLPWRVTRAERRERRKNPPPPFTTSTLQQEAAKRLRFTARRTMRVAQKLYEGIDLPGGAAGLITYMRTDSTRVSGAAAKRARSHVEQRFGVKYLPRSPRLWGGRQQKGAQEAHEAIRPTDPLRTPDRVRRHLDRDAYRLYELIWLRFVAGQMAAAVYDSTTLDFDLESVTRSCLFRATGSVLRFDGFTRLYPGAGKKANSKEDDDAGPLPDIGEGDNASLQRLEPTQHFTKPPARYTEATLVKELEKQGIGRPSTYAQIISTLQSRSYVQLEEKRFVPTPLGETVAGLLIRLFPELFDVSFTSAMESQLDRIEVGDADWRAVLTDFYGPFRNRLDVSEKERRALIRSLMELEDERCPDCAEPLVVRWNRRGRFIGCTGYPECRFTRPADGEARPDPEAIGEGCPECGAALVRRTGRYGPFIGCEAHPDCSYTRPATIPGLTCPQCGSGEVAEKRTRRGKSFWGCVRYPECDWSVWDAPTPVACPTCGAGFLLRKNSRKRGEYYLCPECKAEMAPASVEAGAGGEG